MLRANRRYRPPMRLSGADGQGVQSALGFWDAPCVTFAGVITLGIEI